MEDHASEKAIKKGINSYLNYVKGMKNNFHNPYMRKFINKVDKYVKRILLDSNIPIENRVWRLRDKFRENTKDIISNLYMPELKGQKLKNLKLLCRRLLPLIELSKREGKIIRSRESKVTGVYPFPAAPAEERKLNCSCKYYPSTISGEPAPTTCLCGMDMTYCSKNCGYATNNALATKAYEADTLVLGGLSGAVAWRNVHGVKVRSYQQAHTRNKREYRAYQDCRYDEIERYSTTGHVGKY